MNQFLVRRCPAGSDPIFRRAHRAQRITSCILLALIVALALLPLRTIAGATLTLEDQLIEAAGRGDLAQVKTLLDADADLNARDEDGETALMWAAASGDPHDLGLVAGLGNGADIDARNKMGREGFARSTRRLSAGVVKLLLERGADVNSKDKAGETALMKAARVGDEDVAKVLKAHGADVTLIIAALLGDKEAVKRFLEAGGSVNASAADGLTALTGAATRGHKDVVILLLEKGSGANSRDKATALVGAAQMGNVDMVRILLDKGVVKDSKDLGVALVGAAMWGYTDVVRLLLDKGADINATQTGVSALMGAAARGHVDVVSLVLDKGVDVNAKTDIGRSALMDAAEMGHVDVVRVLLARGADLSAKDGYGTSALLGATKMGHVDVVNLLKAQGAKE